MEEMITNLEFSNNFWEIFLPLILMVFDNAWKTKKISSSKMRDGLGKKLAELVYIIVGILISYAFNLKAVGYFISLYIVYMELVSIAENCSKLGVRMPKQLKDKLNNNDGSC